MRRIAQRDKNSGVFIGILCQTRKVRACQIFHLRASLVFIVKLRRQWWEIHVLAALFCRQGEDQVKTQHLERLCDFVRVRARLAEGRQTAQGGLYVVHARGPLRRSGWALMLSIHPEATETAKCLGRLVSFGLK